MAAGAALAQDTPHQGSERQNPFRNDAQAVAAGGELFQIHCAACHGAKGEGGSGPDLSRGGYGVGDRDEDLHAIVMRGRDVMPGFRRTLGEENVWRVVTFLRTFSGRESAAAIGDAAAGERLFWGRGGCGQCHRVGANGASSGPNLTEIGVRRGEPHLRESIVNPGADVPRDYNVVAVVTADGKTIEGIQRHYDTFSAHFLDLQSNFHSYLRSEVKDMTRSQKSLMPAYKGMFSEAELNDLVAYLSGLGRYKQR
jgi:putative heme-binding domain-containing protein